MHKEVEDLEQFSIAVNWRYSRTQLSNIALQVIKSIKDYQRALELEYWYDIPLVQQT